MSDFFLSGRVVYLILALMIVEVVAVAIHHRRTGRGISLPDLLPVLVSGGGLLVAWRLASAGAWWGWIVLSLVAALAGHLADIGCRWRRRPGAPRG